MGSSRTCSGLLAAILPALLAAATAAGSAAQENPATPPGPLRNAYFGDLHVHTRYSFDAYQFAVRTEPDDAYRYARGESIDHPGGFRFQLQGQPLDFLAVTDHGQFLDAMPAVDDPENTFFGRIFTGAGRSGAEDEEPSPGGPNAWQAIIDAAEAHYEPGAFTTFIGYEFTAFSEGRGNLHRNVIFLGEAPPAPFTVDTSQDPEDLWQWLDELRAGGIEALAIPHNSNGSNGHMFKLETVSGQPLDAAYAEQRTRNEPWSRSRRSRAHRTRIRCCRRTTNGPTSRSTPTGSARRCPAKLRAATSARPTATARCSRRPGASIRSASA